MEVKHRTQVLSIKSMDNEGVFTGYASVFDKVDLQNEIVAAGAFDRSLGSWRMQGTTPAMLWMHDPTQPIGLWLSLQEDQNGLAVRGKLALRTQKGAEAYELLKLKALTGLSIGYRVVSSRIDPKRKARVLTDVELFEISLVTFPANEAARVNGVKSPKHPLSLNEGDAQTRAVVSRLYRTARILRTDAGNRRGSSKGEIE